MTTPDDIAAAARMLNGVGLGHIDARIIGPILDDRPDIRSDATAWGWDDTIVRDELCKAVACRLLGISDKEYVRRIRSGETTLDEAVRTAHARWLADNPTPPNV